MNACTTATPPLRPNPPPPTTFIFWGGSIDQVELEDPAEAPGTFRDMPFTSGLGWTWSGKTFDADNAKSFRCVSWRVSCFVRLACLPPPALLSTTPRTHPPTPTPAAASA